MKIIKKRKGQNEIVGFVMIVVIVIIIGLFLLVFYLGRKPVEIRSQNSENFLKASLLYTTTCKENLEFLDLQELAKKCYNKEMCEEGDSCTILNETYSNLLEEAWKINSNRPVNYYSLNIYYEENSSKISRGILKEDILVLEKGNCTGSKTGADAFFRHDKGDVFLELQTCSV